MLKVAENVVLLLTPNPNMHITWVFCNRLQLYINMVIDIFMNPRVKIEIHNCDGVRDLFRLV